MRAVDSFSKETQDLLDRLSIVANDYNAAVLDIRPGCRDLLRQRIELALAQTTSSAEYTEWFKHVTRGTLDRSAIRRGEVTPSEHDWFYRLVFAPPDVALILANAWVEAWPIQQPTTVGWLLAESPDRAIDVVCAGFTWSVGTDKPPPREWVEDILRAMYEQAEDAGVFQEPRDMMRDLVGLLEQAENLLAGAIREIRDRYEGGEPLV